MILSHLVPTILNQLQAFFKQWRIQAGVQSWLSVFQTLSKKTASGVLAIFPCSRIASTLRAQQWLWPCWTNFFEQRLAFGRLGFLPKMRLLTSTFFNIPFQSDVIWMYWPSLKDSSGYRPFILLIPHTGKLAG